MAKKKQQGIFDDKELQLSAKQWASEGLKKAKTVDLLKQAEPKYRTGDIVLFRPVPSGLFADLFFKVQTTFDKSQACHAEMIFSANGDEVVTLGSAMDGLKWREHTIGTQHKVIRITDVSPFDNETKMKIMEDFFDEKGENFGKGYPLINTAISGVNRGLDYMTLGLFKRIDFGLYNGSADCSATCAQICYVMYPGHLFSRHNDRDLIPPRMVTPGDCENSRQSMVVKEWD